MAVISRRQYDHPALATAGGSGLHAAIENLYTVLGNDSMSRYKAFVAVANSSVGVIAHEFGLDFANLKVQIFTGTYPALTLVSDPIGSGWTVAATSGLASRSIDVTAPASGGPHTYSVLVSHESNASEFIPGLVSIGAQSWAGAKTFLGPIIGTDTTDSSSSITGAFKTAGGMGIAKKLYVGTDAFIGNAGAASNALTITNNGYITSSTSDGTDDKSMTIAGGGGGTTWNQNRGAGIILKGNDVGGLNLDGEIQYYAGNSGVANGRHRFIAGGVDIAIGSQTGAWTFADISSISSSIATFGGNSLENNGNEAITIRTIGTGTSARASLAGRSGGSLRWRVGSSVGSGFVTGAAANDLCLMTNTQAIFISADNGTTSHASMTTAGAWTLGPSTGATSNTFNGKSLLSGTGTSASHITRLVNGAAGASRSMSWYLNNNETRPVVSFNANASDLIEYSWDFATASDSIQVQLNTTIGFKVRADGITQIGVNSTYTQQHNTYGYWDNKVSQSIGVGAIFRSATSLSSGESLDAVQAFDNTIVCATIGVAKTTNTTNRAGYIALKADDGAFWYVWVDNTGDVRISNNATHVGGQAVGTVVGTQT